MVKIKKKKKISFFYNRSKFLYFFGGVSKEIKSKGSVSNYISMFFQSGFNFLFLNVIFFLQKKAFFMLYSNIFGNQKILIASHLIELRQFFRKVNFFFFRKNLELSRLGWFSGSLSNFFLGGNHLRFFPNLVVCPAADYDAHIVQESYSVLRPTVGLTDGRFSINFLDYPIYIAGNLVSYGKALSKLVIDGFFLKKKKNVFNKNC